MNRANRGFTIIEVLLVLAITGLLFLIGFYGVGGRTRTVQTTDSMRSLESFIQEQYNEVRTGVNPEGVGGTDENTIVLGRIFGFQPGDSTVTIFYVIGDRLFGDELNLAPGEQDIHLINRAEPSTLVATQEYELPWSSTFLTGRNGTEAADYSYFGFIRSPGSSQIYPVAVKTSFMPDADFLAPADTDTAVGNEVDLRMCFDPPSGQPASLTIGPGTQEESVVITFNDDMC